MEAEYARWCEDPKSVDATWAAFFEGFELGSAQLKRKPETSAAPASTVLTAPISDEDCAFYGRVTSLIYNYRTLGHTQANINPIEEAERNPRLRFEQFGFSEADLDHEVSNSFFRHGDKMKLREMVEGLEATYSGKIGFEFEPRPARRLARSSTASRRLRWLCAPTPASGLSTWSSAPWRKPCPTA